MSRTHTLKMNKFSWDMVKKTCTIAMIGSRGSGKSVLIRDLLYHFQDMPIGTVISPTERLNRNFSDIVPSMFIHDEFRDEILQRVLKRQMLVKQQSMRDPEFADVDPHAFLLMDDCMYDDKAWAVSKPLKEMFFNGRHYMLMTIVSLQFVLGLGPRFRANIDWCFIFKEAIQANRKRLYEYFCGMFPSQGYFNSVLDQVTDDYGCLVVHNACKSTRLEDQVFYYKAELHPDSNWRTCLDMFWDLNAKHERESLDDDDDDFSKPFTSNKIVHVDVRKRG